MKTKRILSVILAKTTAIDVSEPVDLEALVIPSIEEEYELNSTLHKDRRQAAGPMLFLVTQ